MDGVKKKKNNKALDRVCSEIEHISIKGKKRIIRDLREKYPNYQRSDDFDFSNGILSNDLLYLYLLLGDSEIREESIIPDIQVEVGSTVVEDDGRYSPFDIDYNNKDIEKSVVVDNFFSIDRHHPVSPIGDGGCCGGCSHGCSCDIEDANEGSGWGGDC